MTVRLEQVTVRTALNAVCESISCRWSLQKNGLKIEPLSDAAASRPSAALDTEVTIQVTNANLQQFMASVASMMNGDFTFDPSLDKKTITLQGPQTLRSALDSACAQGGCRWKVAEGTKPVLEVKAK